MPTLKEPMTYRSNRLSLRIEVKGGPSESHSPASTLHDDVKMVEFRDGLYTTTDPEIVEALDRRTDVWRTDDPASELRARFGSVEYEKLRKQFASLQSEESPTA